jgi:nucleoside-diphosphate-sugar epimerase
VRVFLAGASGAIGRQLVPALVEAGHEVAGTTRSEGKAGLLRELGAEPVVIDVFDARGLRDAVVAAAPDVVMDQLTDLPQDPALISEKGADNIRIRTEGTANLIAAARAAEARRFLTQSIAWPLEGDAQRSVEDHERIVLEVGGVVLRYGQLYGPGTYFEEGKPEEPPMVHVADAARRTVPLLDAETGIVEIVDE